jgi:hypothetical protein
MKRTAATSEFNSIFAQLRAILQRNAGSLAVKEDSKDCFCLEAAPGPAALRAWGGKVRREKMPVVWVQIGKAYVSFHCMAFYMNPKLLEGMSKELKARMQGKSCLNFKSSDETLFKELEQLTVKGLAGFKKAGFVTESRPTAS